MSDTYNAPPKNPENETAEQTSSESSAKSMMNGVSRDVRGMVADGMQNPATKPVLTAAAIGGVAAVFVPFLSIPVGILGGAAYALYNRNKAKG